MNVTNMTLFNRHGPCIGLTLFRFARWNIELWYCPKKYEIELHSHPNEHIELMYLFGKTTFYRDKGISTECFKPKWYHIFRTFSVKPGQLHSFSVSNCPLIFINISKFLQGHKPMSASVDFKQV